MTHKKKKTWREKLNDSKDLPKVITFTESMNTGWGTGTVLVPAPIEIDEIMRTVPKGKLITINEIRKLLAKKHDVDFVCPLTTGIFAWIAAHAAMEDLQNGKKKVTPFWRTLKKGGELNPKYPGGTEEQKTRLESEGHAVIQKRKKQFVQNYELKLIKTDE